MVEPKSFEELFPEFKEHYPDKVGDYNWMRRYTNDCQRNFSGGAIIEAVEEGRLAELLAEAERAVQIDMLWVDMNSSWSEREQRKKSREQAETKKEELSAGKDKGISRI